MTFDILLALSELNLDHFVLENLSALDLKSCALVSSSWNFLVENLFERQQKKSLGQNWDQNLPKSQVLECQKQRSVCTISSLAVDEEGLVCGLGSSGDLELWNRRTNERIWRCHTHDDGIYGVDFNSKIVVSGGDDELVKIYNRLPLRQKLSKIFSFLF